MKTRTIANVVLYTGTKKILLQDRTSISKFGEHWSFFGGGVEPNETAEEAARREIKEELDFDVNNLVYLGRASKQLKLVKPPYEETFRIYEAFLVKVKEDTSQFTVLEGDGMRFFSIAEARKLVMVPEIDMKILQKVEDYLSR